MAGQIALTVGSAAAAAALSQREDWEPITLFLLLLALSVVSELFRLETANLHISATFLSVVLAMTLLGPTPAAVLGVTTYLVNALKVRASWRRDARERVDVRVLPAGRRPAVRGARRPGRSRTTWRRSSSRCSSSSCR